MDFVNEYGFMERLQGNDHVVTYGSHVIIPHEDGIGGDILIRMELLTPLLDRMIELALKRKREEDSVTFSFDTNILNVDRSFTGGSKNGKLKV